MDMLALTFLSKRILSIPSESTHGGAHDKVWFLLVFFLRASLLNSLKDGFSVAVN